MLSVLALPIIGGHLYFGGMNDDPDQSIVQAMSFGNMGFASSQCSKDIIVNEKFDTTLSFIC